MGDHLTAEQIQEQADAGDRLRDEVRDGDKTRYKIEWDEEFGWFYAYRWDGGKKWTFVRKTGSDTIEGCEAKLRAIHCKPKPQPRVERKELFL